MKYAFKDAKDGYYEIDIAEGATFPAWALPLTPCPVQVPTVAVLIKAAISRIDGDTDSLIRDVIGHRGNEYKLADEQARAFKSAGYIGTVPGSVQSWTTAKGWTATQAADDIIAVADNWLSAQASIRSNRLSCKEDARKATTAAGVDTALAAWATFVAQIRTSLGV